MRIASSESARNCDSVVDGDGGSMLVMDGAGGGVGGVSGSVSSPDSSAADRDGVCAELFGTRRRDDRRSGSC